jgi:glycosyltransferase involved in cell wall biosynthesis
MSGRVRTDGKFFALDGRRFVFRGLHHHARSDGAVAMAQLREAGFSVIVAQSVDAAFLAAAADHDLYVLAEVGLPPWREFRTASRRQTRGALKTVVGGLASAITAFHGDAHLLGAVIRCPVEPAGSPTPPRLVGRVLDDLARSLRDLEAAMLVAAYLPPTARECPIELDFLIAAPHPAKALSTALGEAHLLVGDRPLVLQAVCPPPRSRFDVSSYEATIDAAAARGAAGTILAGDRTAASSSFLATQDSRAAIARSNVRTVADLAVEWPTVTIIICAYNAAATLDECLDNVALLDYPQLEVIVVDDGSIDDTAGIVDRHHRVRLISLDHAGLSSARNVGFREARGEVVAYLDADAYPPPEWVRFLVLGLTGDRVVASGGPNVPPPDERPGAQVVAHCPGAPIPFLHRADRALHLPGCNLALRREVLHDLGGFDPELTSAEDVDLQLRLRDRGHELGYHPAAFVWHRRRPGVRTYLSQQRGYGRGQAFAVVRSPAAYRHHRLNKFRRAAARGTRLKGPVAVPVCYRSLWWRRRCRLDLAHQWGIPFGVAVVATAPLGLARRMLATPAAMAAALLTGLFCVDAALAMRDLQRRPRRLLTAVQIAAYQLLRPPAFVWGTVTQAASLRLRRALDRPRYR